MKSCTLKQPMGIEIFWDSSMSISGPNLNSVLCSQLGNFVKLYKVPVMSECKEWNKLGWSLLLISLYILTCSHWDENLNPNVTRYNVDHYTNSCSLVILAPCSQLSPHNPASPIFWKFMPVHHHFWNMEYLRKSNSQSLKSVHKRTTMPKIYIIKIIFEFLNSF